MSGEINCYMQQTIRGRHRKIKRVKNILKSKINRTYQSYKKYRLSFSACIHGQTRVCMPSSTFSKRVPTLHFILSHFFSVGLLVYKTTLLGWDII